MPQDLAKSLFEEQGGLYSVGGMIRGCSYGQATLTSNNSKIAPTLDLGCNGTIPAINVNDRQYPSYSYNSTPPACSVDTFLAWGNAALINAEKNGIDTTARLFKCVAVLAACGI